MSQEKMLQVDGDSIWTVCRGSGVPLLLCSGGPGAADYLGPLASMLDDIAKVIRFDQRGCGRTSGSGPFDLRTTLSDMEAVREHYGTEKWIVGGHSWGANLALAYALENPGRVMGLVYICGSGAQHDREWSEEYHRNLAETGERRPPEEFPGNDQVNHRVNESWWDYIREPDFLRRVAGLSIPSLFVHARMDIRPSWPAKQLAGLMRRTQEATVEGAGHYIWLDRPDELESILRRFVMELKGNVAW